MSTAIDAREYAACEERPRVDAAGIPPIERDLSNLAALDPVAVSQVAPPLCEIFSPPSFVLKRTRAAARE